MASPKEECFASALNDYKRFFVEGAPTRSVNMWQQWYQEWKGGSLLNTTWMKQPPPGITGNRWWQNWVWMIQATRKRQAAGKPPLPNPPQQNPLAWRTPDFTLGNKVYDLKFTNAAGGIDPWHQGTGMSGNDQYTDYTNINRQSDPSSRAMALDKNSCQCASKELEPVMECVRSPLMDALRKPLPAPVWLPRGWRIGPRGIPIPVP
jgi:hypothetical protein